MQRSRSPACPLSSHIFFFSTSTQKRSYPRRFVDCAITISASILCDCRGPPSYSKILCSSPPQAYSSMQRLVLCKPPRQHSVFGHIPIPNALHMLSAKVSKRKSSASVRHSRCPCAVLRQRFIVFPSETEQSPHQLCLPSFYLVHRHPAPRPTYASIAKKKNAVDLIHCSFALYPPRHVFAS